MLSFLCVYYSSFVLYCVVHSLLYILIELYVCVSVFRYFVGSVYCWRLMFRYHCLSCDLFRYCVWLCLCIVFVRFLLAVRLWFHVCVPSCIMYAFRCSVCLFVFICCSLRFYVSVLFYKSVLSFCMYAVIPWFSSLCVSVVRFIYVLV